MISPKDFGAVGDGVADDYTALQAFFVDCEVIDHGTVNVDGTYKVTRPIVYGQSMPPKTLSFAGNFHLRISGKHAIALTLKGWRDGQWDMLRVTGPGSVSGGYTSKTCQVGLLLDDTQRCDFGKLRTSMFSFAGVVSGLNNTSACDYGNMRANDCGSGARSKETWYGLKTNWSNPVNSGSDGSVAQKTTIDVDVLPDPAVYDGSFGATTGKMPFFIRISDRPYFIYAIDPVQNRLSVFPWIDATVTPGEADYIYGGGLYLIGNDSNVACFNLLDALRCGVGLSAASIYGPQGLRLLTQFCGVGVCFGAAPGAAGYGSVIRGAYFEGNVQDVIHNHRMGRWQYHDIDPRGVYNLDEQKCVSMGNARLANNSLSTRFDVPPLGRV